jgi:MFS family permease
MALERARRSFDIAGAGYLTLALFGILYGCTQLPVEDNYLDPWSWLVFVAGFAFGAMFIRHERRAVEPLIDPRLFSANPEFTRAAIAFAAMFASLPLTLFVLPIVLINALEMRAWDVGVIMALSALFTTVMSPVAGWASDRFRPELMSSTGALVRGAGYIMLLGVTAASGFVDVLVPLLVIGIGTGLFFSPNNALLLAHAPPERAGMVSGLFGTLRQGGYALGFALIASLFTVIQTGFELNWAYASLERLPGHVASQMAQVFDGGGIWSPELLIFILRVAVLVCTAILALSLLNSLPRVRMTGRRELAAIGGLAAAAAAGTWALAVLLPGGLAVTAAERAAGEPPPALVAVAPFGMEKRAALEVEPAAGATATGAYLQYCAACHGPAGRGIEGLGVDLRASAFVRGARDADLKEFLRMGRDPSSPASRTGRAMPSFAWLEEDVLEQVVRDLRTGGAAP